MTVLEADPLLRVRADLARDGFARAGRLLDDVAVAALQAACAQARATTSPSDYGLIMHDAWRELPAFERALRAGPVGRLGRALLGADEVVLFQDHVVWKPPATPAEVSWHQDRGYWPLEACRGLTVWVALDDADAGNGCLSYLPGTHRLGERRAADFTPGAAQPARPDLPPIDAAGREREVVTCPVRAGEALVHDPLVWHMSPPNASARDRRAWSITLVGPEARWAPARAPHPYNWSLQPVPGAPLDPSRFPRL